MSSVLKVIDSHTAGEATRVVIEGVPDLGTADIGARQEKLAVQADWVRTALMLEPRGAPWMVGAVLQDPVNSSSHAGVIFFNNAGYLGMCGHGLIGVVTTLSYLGRIEPGRHQFETSAGEVSTILHEDGSVSFENVISSRLAKDVCVDVDGLGLVMGDVAYGGNNFFLTAAVDLARARLQELVVASDRIRCALHESGLRGLNGHDIDHIELIGPPRNAAIADTRNFVFCPGWQYDRSPCGTGLSAKLACLAADGLLAPGEPWVMESFIGSTFEGTYQHADSGVLPKVRGRAFITGDATIVINPQDPFKDGFDSALLAGKS